ncbi:MAG: hypothetical protein IKS52_01465 [Clostridia bacterium]|nr:hypothetical protein [Clostridia bacterium]
MLPYPDTQPWPRPPAIRKLGTIRCDMVETTPIVFRDELYRFEYVRPEEQNPSNTTGSSYFHFVHVRTNQPSVPFARNHHLGSAFTDGGVMYVSGLRDAWGSDTVDFFRSDDLVHWERYAELRVPGWKIYNTNMCRMGGEYILLMEMNDPSDRKCVPFTFRFARSKDMAGWEVLPEDRVFQPDRYAGGPAIYTLPDDPHFYVLYLEAIPCGRYVNGIARSGDLIRWEYSPINPVLMYEPEKDKQIASPFLTPAERERIAAALDVNNSDMEMCEYLGRTIIYYSWGNQHGNEFLAEACYEGPMAELLHGFFA